MNRTRRIAQALWAPRPLDGPPKAELRPRRPYADGWFAVAFADELAPGRLLRRRFMGEDLVVYRTRGGAVRVVEPYCPHLGAHLGHGGWIDGEAIVCPFHHFAFGLDGACVRTGYGTRPPAARLRQREAREVNGAILVWHQAGGGAPAWEVPSHPMSGYPRPFRHVTTLIDHPQDIVENAIDIGHIGPVHGYRDARVRQPFQATGASFTVGAAGRRVFPVAGAVEIVFDIAVHGLGYLWVDARMPRLGASATFQALATPLDPSRVEMRFSVALRVGDGGAAPARAAASRLLTTVLGPVFRRDLALDFPIWEHRIYLEHPRLASGDGPIGAYRRWTEQFYPAGSRQDASTTPALSA